MIPVALTIAGSDPSGGAGIQADLKTFHQHGVYGEAVITLLTVQNTVSVSRVEILDPALVREQIRAVVQDIPPLACKTGALGSAEVIRVVAGEAQQFRWPLIVDPVMVSKHGARLIADDARSALTQVLLPLATLVTPNIPEAEVLTGLPVENTEQMRTAAMRILEMGCRAVLIKGGHLSGEAIDLYADADIVFELPSERIATRHTHGTGCTYAAAITARLALGDALPEAVRKSKTFIAEAIRTSPGLGNGSGPVNHFARVD